MNRKKAPLGEGNDFKLQEHIEKGQFYFISGKYEYAVREYEKALLLSPENPEILYSLGVAYESVNRYMDAREKYILTLKKDPGHKRAKEHLDRLLG